MKLLLLLSHTCEMRSQISNSKTPNDFKFEISEFRSLPVKKIDEGRENNAANKRGPARASRVACQHTSRHTSPEDGDLADSRKGPRSSSVEGSLPSSLANRYFDCQKTKRAGFKPPREAARSFNSRDFALRFGSGRPLPLINA